MHFEVNNVFSCRTESKASLEKTFKKGKGFVKAISIFQHYLWLFTDCKLLECSYFWFGTDLKHCSAQLAELNDFLGGGEISPPLGV